MRILTLFVIILTLNSCDFTSARTYFTEATKFEEQNNLTEAINLLNKAILKDEDYIPAYINRAVDKAMLGHYASAIEDYDIVLKKDPENTLALLNRGKNKHRLDDYKGAVQDFQKALDSLAVHAALKGEFISFKSVKDINKPDPDLIKDFTVTGFSLSESKKNGGGVILTGHKNLLAGGILGFNTPIIRFGQFIEFCKMQLLVRLENF